MTGHAYRSFGIYSGRFDADGVGGVYEDTGGLTIEQYATRPPHIRGADPGPTAWWIATHPDEQSDPRADVLQRPMEAAS